MALHLCYAICKKAIACKATEFATGNRNKTGREYGIGERTMKSRQPEQNGKNITQKHYRRIQLSCQGLWPMKHMHRSQPENILVIQIQSHFYVFLPFTLNAKKLILSELLKLNNLTLSLINNVWTYWTFQQLFSFFTLVKWGFASSRLFSHIFSKLVWQKFIWDETPN